MPAETNTQSIGSEAWIHNNAKENSIQAFQNDQTDAFYNEKTTVAAAPEPSFDLQEYAQQVAESAVKKMDEKVEAAHERFEESQELKVEEKGYLEAAKDKVTDAFGTVKDSVGSAYVTVKDAVVQAWAEPKEEARERAQSAASTLQDSARGARDAAGTVGERMKEVAVNAGEYMLHKTVEVKERVKELPGGIRQGTKRTADEALRKVQETAQTARDTLDDHLSNNMEHKPKL